VLIAWPGIYHLDGFALLAFAEAHSGAAAENPTAVAQQKIYKLEKPRIECEWRDRCNRYPSTA
jgi:hypothetical protein